MRSRPSDLSPKMPLFHVPLSTRPRPFLSQVSLFHVLLCFPPALVHLTPGCQVFSLAEVVVTGGRVAQLQACATKAAGIQHPGSTRKLRNVTSVSIGERVHRIKVVSKERPFVSCLRCNKARPAQSPFILTLAFVHVFAVCHLVQLWYVMMP